MVNLLLGKPFVWYVAGSKINFAEGVILPPRKAAGWLALPRITPK